MNMLYLTTARHPKDYERFLHINHVAPNPSNQNFHTKLINLLTKNGSLQVLSTRPMSKGIFLKAAKQELYFYPSYLNFPIVKRLGIHCGGHKILSRFKPEIIFVDVMNANLLHLAKTLKKHSHAKVIGIVTDNPINITGAKKKYSETIFELSQLCDGYIVLTEGLNRLFNPKNKPALVIPGFIEDQSIETIKKEKYAFFAGALYNRYGVGELIEAFKNDNMDLKLLIAGHGPLSTLLTKEAYTNIEFLGLISPEIAFQLSVKATLNINPRPIDARVDTYSVPSKMLDYINSGSITLSTVNSEIQNLVGDDVYWLPDNSPEAIRQAIKDILADYERWTMRAKRAKQKLESLLSSKEIMIKINDLINKI